MTKEEVIKTLRELWRETNNSWYEEAFDIAIEALQEPKTGEWELDPNGMDWNIPAWRCSECGFVANYIGVGVNDICNNPMNWAGSNFCPNCGTRMSGSTK